MTKNTASREAVRGNRASYDPLGTDAEDTVMRKQEMGSTFRTSLAVGLAAFIATLGTSSVAHAADGDLPPLDAKTVGQRAVATSFDARGSVENLRAAAARVDASWSAFLPRLSGTARYTRDSDFTPPLLPGLVGTAAPTGTLDPKATESIAISFPTLVNNYALEASIAVPITDYFVRITPAYESARHAKDAAEHDLRLAQARAFSDGETAFYTWLRAKAAVAVAEQTLRDQEKHRKDVENQFNAGNASKADVLRADTSVAAAEYSLEQVKSLVAVAETQLRTALHVTDDAPLSVSESLDATLPPPNGSLAELTQEGQSSREEVKSLESNAAAARKQITVARAGYFPVISAFGGAQYDNPNPRVIPSTDVWYATWDLGIQATWSPNDVLLGSAKSNEAIATADRLVAERGRVRDAIRIEVRQQWEAVRQADVGILTATRELASATEAETVANELFNSGRETSTTLTDAETDLTRARLDLLNARADARIARVRLDHATGRDVPIALQGQVR